MTELDAWGAELDRLMERIGGRFARSEARQRASAPVPICWAEQAQQNGKKAGNSPRRAAAAPGSRPGVPLSAPDSEAGVTTTVVHVPPIV
jgi:hypothetical protein